MNIMKKVLLIMILSLICGCMTTSDPKVESTKSWEGHYFTIEQFQQSTKDISLDKDESIWVLSNHTLNRLLQNIGK